MTEADARIARIRSRLLAAPQQADFSTLEPDWVPDTPFGRPPALAAVLIGLIKRSGGHTVLYTERATTLRAHSGQVAFPGGKIDPADAGAAAAALREANEEVGLDPREAEVLGFLPPYYTGTNYLITPVVAEVHPSAAFVANPHEVSAVFEVPLANLFREASYGTYRIRRGEAEHTTWQIDHEGHRIWGITANLTRIFRDVALIGEEPW